MNAMRYRLDLEYDGTDFWGWQVQPGSRTVQGVVEAALSRIAGAPIRVTGAGRTDRGCHALGQVAHFDWNDSRTPAVIERTLAGLLPTDVRLRALTVAPPEFHARYSASRRAYRYSVARSKSVFTHRHAWQLGEELELTSLARASACLVGEHDFRGFAVVLGGEAPGSGRCRVERADWEGTDGGYRFSIVADRFLTRMVRLLVGALVQVGRGRLDPEGVAARLDRPPQSPRPAAAPALGLTLAWVGYDEGGSKP